MNLIDFGLSVWKRTQRYFLLPLFPRAFDLINGSLLPLLFLFCRRSSSSSSDDVILNPRAFRVNLHGFVSCSIQPWTRFNNILKMHKQFRTKADYFLFFKPFVQRFAEINEILCRMLKTSTRVVIRSIERFFLFSRHFRFNISLIFNIWQLWHFALLHFLAWIREFSLPNTPRRGSSLRTVADCALVPRDSQKNPAKYFLCLISVFFLPALARGISNELYSLSSFPFQARRGRRVRNCDTLNISVT